jgi:hypothetical protein
MMVIIPLIIAIGSQILLGLIINAAAYIKMKCYSIEESVCTKYSESAQEDEPSLTNFEQSLDYSADDESPRFDTFSDYPHSV